MKSHMFFLYGFYDCAVAVPRVSLTVPSISCARHRSASLEQPFEPESPEDENTMETRDDSDKSPGSPPPAYGASPCFKSPVKRSGKKPRECHHNDLIFSKSSARVSTCVHRRVRVSVG